MNQKQLQDMMKQAQKMQGDMQQKQSVIEATEFTATAGGGVVTVTAFGSKQVKSINIEPDLLEVSEKEMLEELLIIAINEVNKQIDVKMEAEMGAMTQGLPF